MIDSDSDAAAAGLIDQRGGLLDRLGAIHLRRWVRVVRPVT